MINQVIIPFNFYNNFKLSIYNFGIIKKCYSTYKKSFGNISYWESSKTKTIHILLEKETNTFLELFIFKKK